MWAFSLCTLFNIVPMRLLAVFMTFSRSYYQAASRGKKLWQRPCCDERTLLHHDKISATLLLCCHLRHQWAWWWRFPCRKELPGGTLPRWIGQRTQLVQYNPMVFLSREFIFHWLGKTYFRGLLLAHWVSFRTCRRRQRQELQHWRPPKPFVKV